MLDSRTVSDPLAVRMRSLPIVTILVALLLPGPSMAAETEAIAVLELQDQSDRLKVSEVQYLSTILRQAVGDAMDRTRFNLMTRETMEVMFGSKGIQCLAGQCLVDVGVRLQANYVVGGTVSMVGGKFAITLEAYETRTRTQKSTKTDKATTMDEAELLVQKLATQVIQEATGATGSARKGEKDGTLYLLANGDGVSYDIEGLFKGSLAKDEPKKIPLALRERPYHVRLSRRGFVDFVSDVVLSNDLRTPTVDPDWVPVVESKATGTLGVLSLRSTPGHAEVSVDGKVWKEPTPTDIDLEAGTHQIQVRKPLYRPVTVVLETPGDGKILPKELLLEPDFGVLEVSVEPAEAEAEIFLNGKKVGSRGVYRNTEQPAGFYELKVEAGGYHGFADTVRVLRMKGTPVRVQLRPAFGSLSIDMLTKVDQAGGALPKLRLDGKPVSVKFTARPENRGHRYQVMLPRVASGVHEVEIELVNYQVETQKVEVRDSEDAKVEGTFGAEFGTLSITSTPPGQPVKLQGKVIGRTPLDRNEAPGTYRVEIEPEVEYLRPIREDVLVQKGKDNQFSRVLAEVLSDLTVLTSPPDAVVAVDGVEKGRAPVNVSALRVGQHRVEARANGYTPKVSLVRLEEGKVLLVRMELQRLGSIEVRCIPPKDVAGDVVIVLDGAEHHATSKVFDALKSDSHQVQCRLGPRVASRDVTTTAGRQDVVVLDLTDSDVIRAVWTKERDAYLWGGSALAAGALAGIISGAVYLGKARTAHGDLQDSLAAIPRAATQAAADAAKASANGLQDDQNRFQAAGWALMSLGIAAAIGSAVTYALIPAEPDVSGRTGYVGWWRSGSVGVSPEPSGAVVSFSAALPF